MPTDPHRRTGGLLNPYIAGRIYDGVYVRRRHLKIAKSILDSHNVTFDTTPRRIKYSSLKRKFRRWRAKRIEDLKRNIRSERADRAMIRHWVWAYPLQARQSHKGATRRIKFIEDELAKLLPRETQADWYRSYVHGKIASCVKARTSSAERHRTVAKAIRSILRKKIVTRSDVGSELNAVAKNITRKEQADRLIRLAYQLRVSIYQLEGEPETLIHEAAQALRTKLKTIDVTRLDRLLPFSYR